MDESGTVSWWNGVQFSVTSVFRGVKEAVTPTGVGSSAPPGFTNPAHN